MLSLESPLAFCSRDVHVRHAIKFHITLHVITCTILSHRNIPSTTGLLHGTPLCRDLMQWSKPKKGVAALWNPTTPGLQVWGSGTVHVPLPLAQQRSLSIVQWLDGFMLTKQPILYL